eukprot:CAMPEP_0202686136 /NCGR_PEP_ID=MMETSP1385-20130828/1931_1 /ASSEMBLY_ACC=CAM_ASM_000861 /TAXON_ID=933848 /ORGANISM="Elphidium margaritaceum" /LENGTH=378 /DNA_ID=CAMNT_0049340653 /DNA_START=295 /DNA_END=1431 /DNA_ORIENTATION=+
MIGIFDPNHSDKVNLIPVTYSFGMKSERIQRQGGKPDVLSLDAQSRHQDLLKTFGSKFAEIALKQNVRLQQTKEATLNAMNSMDSASLKHSLGDENDSETHDSSSRKRKRSEFDDDDDDESESNSVDNSGDCAPYVNIFQHAFSASPFCLWEYPLHRNASKASGVYALPEIIPAHVWQSVKSSQQCDRSWAVWNDTSNSHSGQAFGFVLRCVSFSQTVQQKKSAHIFEQWKASLVLYDLSLRFVHSVVNRPHYVDGDVWHSVATAYLEQYQAADFKMNQHKNKKNKKLRHSMTRRAKMRIVGIILLLALDAGFWSISMDAVKDIADDLKIPHKVIVEIYRFLGCKSIKDPQGQERICMQKKIVHRKPSASVDGTWWNA